MSYTSGSLKEMLNYIIYNFFIFQLFSKPEHYPVGKAQFLA